MKKEELRGLLEEYDEGMYDPGRMTAVLREHVADQDKRIEDLEKSLFVACEEWEGWMLDRGDTNDRYRLRACKQVLGGEDQSETEVGPLF